MNALTPYLAAIHQQDLLQEAAALRQVREYRASKPEIAAWRRGLGGGAQRLSGLLASAATSLDPTVGSPRSKARVSERTVGRALSS
jgi:hypothetical protein